MRRLEVRGPRPGKAYSLVLRSFVEPFFVKHAQGLLTREAEVLNLLAGTDVPAARLHGVDGSGMFCDHPSLLMSWLPGSLRLGGEDTGRVVEQLAQEMAGIHGVDVSGERRPRRYEAWTSAEQVRIPAGAARPDVWERAVEVIRRPVPAYRACFLHRDFHPGNVLFSGEGAGLTITGVVDWVETSWGPADLDVAHCATSLALLHGVPVGMELADRYTAAGGSLSEKAGDHLYWRMLDALAFAPDTEKAGAVWRGLGRADLTGPVLTARLEAYLGELMKEYGG
jgi:aminoglycoside phosphotransferase (APT) family kinase protein